MSTLVLVGNGLSTSYNPDLAMQPLTRKVLAAFDSGIGADAEVLKSFARAAGADQEGLEAVLGALDRVAVALPILQSLSGFGPVGKVAGASLAEAADFMSTVYRVGLGHSLEVIDDLAHDQSYGLADTDRLFGAVPDPQFVTIATLNYDRHPSIEAA